MSSYKYTRRVPALILGVALLTLLTVAVIVPSTASAQSAYHTYTITSGMTSGVTIIGYWDSNAGNITDEVYQLPNGSNATIRQTMRGRGSPSSSTPQVNEVRFLLNQSGLGVGDTDQFPTSIRLTRGTNTVTVTPRSGQIASFGQGIGRDYSNSDSDITTQLANVLVNGQETTVELFYGSAPPSPVQSSDASLSALIISQGILMPVFNTGTYNYASSVENSVTSLSITATPTDNNAIVTGAGLRNLNVGANVLTVTVTAEDGSTTQNYTCLLYTSPSPRDS